MSAEKASLRSSDLDTNSITSMHKRIAQRIPKLNTAQQHRTMSMDSSSGSNNIPESQETEENDVISQESPVIQVPTGKLTPASSTSSLKSLGKSPKPTKKGLSKSNILRVIFFQNNNNNDDSSSNSKS